MKRARFDRRGPMAIAPLAMGMFFDLPEAPRVEMRDGVAVVSICGPLVHHAEPWFDSYDAIKGRVLEALASKPKAVVLSIDSPGGLVSGCFDTSDEIRAACDAAAVPLHAYVDGMAASAAYALASVAQTITVPATGLVGSIGTIEMMADITAQNAMMGVGYEIIASGARKADGNPNAPISDGARAASQARVDELAEVFFAHVATRRPALSVDAVRSLEAGLLTGVSAKTAGLADRVASLDGLVAMLAAGPAPAQAAMTKETSMDENEDKARAALQAIVDDEKSDDKAKGRAKAALAAMSDEEPDGDEKKPDAKHTEPDGDEPEAKGASAQVSARAAGAMAAAASTVEARLAALELERETERKQALFASRSDLGKEVVKQLSTLPFAQAKAIVEAMPRASQKPAASAVVSATRGEGQGDGTASRLPADQKAALDLAMGLRTVSATGVRKSADGNRIELGVDEIVAKKGS